MADLDGVKESKQFHEGVPQEGERFFLKGSGAQDWGMQNRLARIFNPKSGNTVMLAFDHGYFQGPTTGLVALGTLGHEFDAPVALPVVRVLHPAVEVGSKVLTVPSIVTVIT